MSEVKLFLLIFFVFAMSLSQVVAQDDADPQEEALQKVLTLMHQQILTPRQLILMLHQPILMLHQAIQTAVGMLETRQTRVMVTEMMETNKTMLGTTVTMMTSQTLMMAAMAAIQAMEMLREALQGNGFNNNQNGYDNNRQNGNDGNTQDDLDSSEEDDNAITGQNRNGGYNDYNNDRYDNNYNNNGYSGYNNGYGDNDDDGYDNYDVGDQEEDTRFGAGRFGGRNNRGGRIVNPYGRRRHGKRGRRKNRRNNTRRNNTDLYDQMDGGNGYNNFNNNNNLNNTNNNRRFSNNNRRPYRPLRFTANDYRYNSPYTGFGTSYLNDYSTLGIYRRRRLGRNRRRLSNRFTWPRIVAAQAYDPYDQWQGSRLGGYGGSYYGGAGIYGSSYSAMPEGNIKNSVDGGWVGRLNGYTGYGYSNQLTYPWASNNQIVAY
uniref:Uncharacterized protein n=1 Tax=Ditylenchus dipsaci TaxID=166011 RepID=A0A915D0C7_9BILA